MEVGDAVLGCRVASNHAWHVDAAGMQDGLARGDGEEVPVHGLAVPRGGEECFEAEFIEGWDDNEISHVWVAVIGNCFIGVRTADYGLEVAAETVYSVSEVEDCNVNVAIAEVLGARYGGKDPAGSDLGLTVDFR